MRSDDCVKVSCLNGKLKVGDMVLSTPACDYPNMVGAVIEVHPLGSPEHDSGNMEDDVLVNFEGVILLSGSKRWKSIFPGCMALRKHLGNYPLIR